MARSDYALQAVKGIKESFDNSLAAMLESYMSMGIIDFYNTSESFEIFTSTEALDGAKELADAETPPTTKLDDGYSVNIRMKRFGGSITVDEYMQKEGQDNTMKVDTYLTRQRNKLLESNKKLFLTEAHKFFNGAFVTTYYAAPDTVALCGTHSWNTAGSSTFSNAGTAVLSETAVDAVMEYGGAFTDAVGDVMPLNFDEIIVKKGSEAHRTALKLFAFGIQPTAINDINIYEGEFRIVATPYITAANKLNWFMRDSSLDNPLKVGITEMPNLKEPQVLENEAIRTNCTGFWKQGIVNMPYAFYGSTGTGA